MKQLILNVLEDCSTGQINLASSAARETIANLIMASIKSKGWYLNLGTHKSNELDTADDNCSHGNDLNSICHERDEEQAREIWICSICGKSTYAVDYDYIGTNTNHLSCELDIELAEKRIEESIE